MSTRSGFDDVYHYPFINSGSVSIDDTEYRWKAKGTSSKVVVRRCGSRSPTSESSTPSLASQLVNKSTNAMVAQSHSHRRSSIFRKPRDMSLEISRDVVHAVDIVLLTFLLVWRERESERKRALGLDSAFL